MYCRNLACYVMDIDASSVIGDYLRLTQEIFTSDEFYLYLKTHGVKITKTVQREINVLEH